MTVEADTLPSEDEPSAAAIAGFYAGMARYWHPVLDEARLPADRPVGVRLLGKRLVLARLNGTIVAFPDICRHYQARLSLGEIIDWEGRQALQCPYHGWAYAADGTCVRVPQLAAGHRIPARASLEAIHVSERYGLIWVCLGEPAFPVAHFPEYDDDSFRKVTLREREPTRTSSTRMIMATLDDTHFPWVHEGILGHRAQPQAPDHKVWREEHELVVRYSVEQPRNESTTGIGTQSAEPVRVVYTDYVGMPNIIRLVKDMEAGRYVIWLATCPLSYKLVQNFWIFARNYDLDPANDEEYQRFSAHVRMQDKPIVESQRPWLLPPFWTHTELPLGPADLPIIEYQRWLQELNIVTEL